jgi:glycosyltransferase involved in cell wall biosynthesis
MGSARHQVLIIPEWFPSVTEPGRAPWAREQAAAASSEVDIAVAVATPQRRATLWRLSDERDGALRVVRSEYPDLGEYRASFPGRIAALWRALRHLRATGFKPELIHAHVFYSGLVALLLGRSHDLPVIVSEHFTAFPRGRVRGLGLAVARATFQRAALVCPASTSLQEDIQALGINARFRVMPNAIDSDLFHPAGLLAPQHDRPRLLTVASLDEKKGHVHLFEAIAACRRAGLEVEARIAGEGPLRASLESDAKRLGIQNVVHLLGALSKGEVAREMRAADALVLPSLYENAPVVISEALASGLPVIATAVGDVPRMLGPNDGFVVPPGDSTALKAAIAALADDPPRPDARRALKLWGKGPVGAKWAAIYHEEIARRRARRSSAP